MSEVAHKPFGLGSGGYRAQRFRQKLHIGDRQIGRASECRNQPVTQVGRRHSQNPIRVVHQFFYDAFRVVDPSSTAIDIGVVIHKAMRRSGHSDLALQEFWPALDEVTDAAIDDACSRFVGTHMKHDIALFVEIAIIHPAGEFYDTTDNDLAAYRTPLDVSRKAVAKRHSDSICNVMYEGDRESPPRSRVFRRSR